MNVKGTVVAGAFAGGMALFGAAAAHADPTPIAPEDLYGLTSLADAFAGTVSNYESVTIDELLGQTGVDAQLRGIDGNIATVLPGVEYFLKDLSLGQWAGQTEVPASVGLADAGLPNGGYTGSFGDQVLEAIAPQLILSTAPGTDAFDASLVPSAFIVDFSDLFDPFGVLASADLF